MKNSLNFGISNLFYKIFADKKQRTYNRHITGLDLAQWNYFFCKVLENHLVEFCKSSFILFNDNDAAEESFEIFKEHFPNINCLFLPGAEHSPYSSYLGQENELLQAFSVMSNLATHNSQQHTIIFCTLPAFFYNRPRPEFWRQHQLILKKDDIIAPRDLAQQLTSFGYRGWSTIEGPGSFSSRGEIFDIFPVNGTPIRIQYFDDLIEFIFPLDTETFKADRNPDNQIVNISICAAPGIFVKEEFRNQLRESIPVPQTQFKKRFEKRKGLFENLAQGQLFENYSSFFPLFFNETCTIQDYIKGPFEIIIVESEKSIRSAEQFLTDIQTEFAKNLNDINDSNIMPSPNSFFELDFSNLNSEFNTFQKNAVLIDHMVTEVNLNSQSIEGRNHINIEHSLYYLKRNIGPTQGRPDFIQKVFTFLKKEFEVTGEIIFSSTNDTAIAEFKHLIEIHHVSAELKSRITFEKFNLSSGLFHQHYKSLVLTEQDLFSYKHNNKKRKQTTGQDLFAEQLSTLKKGDFVVHSEHGIGEYLGLESLTVAGTNGDFLVISYAEGDKVYVPVYRANLIQKHADKTSNIKPTSLRQNKFIQAKERARISAKALAFDLLKLLAEREISRAFAFSPPDETFKEFELAFPYDETADQEKAIEDIINCMQKEKPMDFLLCGDVGLGKTEVAMRAAFKAVLDHKQVAVVVPTTILALQHYNSFKKRFKDFPVNIDYVSRFKGPAECKKAYADLAEGKIDIIIGTHKLFSDNIVFKDLGLVIVDEEHRFGVGHKEKLKLLKASVDFLTLTATPIPRTLQLAYMSLRDLALIKTPPPKRQAVKTFIIKNDDQTIKDAIEKELSRGGQVFIVHNRVQDIEQYFAYIKELIPSAKILYAHGQLAEKDLEKRVQDFYDGKYQILIATTIIESGIDIPNANTIIIDRADTFGIAQLHQLRGRIGRSDRKAYAYFVVPGEKPMSPESERRLKAIQTYTDIGAGFALASCDLEIRGAGDILGADQSGHIENVGLELFTELLRDEINELKGQKKVINRNVEITSPFNGNIPEKYISDPAHRLKYYKKISNAQNDIELDGIITELEDFYGAPPQAVLDLFNTLRVRNIVQQLGVKSLSVAGSILVLKFDREILENHHQLRNKIIELFISRPKIYQFSPDYKVVYTHKELINSPTLFNLVKDIARQVIPC